MEAENQASGRQAGALSPEQLKCPKEGVLFACCAVFSFLVYGSVAVLLLVAVVRQPVVLIPLLIIAAAAWFVSLVVRAAFVTYVRGNGLLVGPDQLPQVHEAVKRAADALGVQAPQVILIQFGGLRAAVTKVFLGSRILVLTSDLLVDHGEGQELDMAIGRELAHFRFHHIPWRFWLFPSMALPYLYPAYRRATEYTADRCGLFVSQQAAAERTLLIEAAGGPLGRQANPVSYHQQVTQSGGFWTTLLHLLSVQPGITWRASELLRAISRGAEPAPQPRRSILATILCAFVPGGAGQAGPLGAAGGLLAPVVLAVLLVAMVPAAMEGRRRAQDAKLSVQLRSLSLAVHAYATIDESGGLLPVAREQLRPYIPGPDAFQAPDGGQITYLVEEVARRYPEIRNTPPRLYQLDEEIILFYHRAGKDRFAVAYAYGYADIIPEQFFHEQKDRSIRLLRGEPAEDDSVTE